MITETAAFDDGDYPLPSIRRLVERRGVIEAELETEVRRARVAGYSWREIADALGVSKQAANRKYGRA